MSAFVRSATPRRQRGLALIVSLILLIVVTMLGIAGMQNTSLQERMSSNLYDRSLAMQATEAALRAAEFAITANADIGLDCTPTSANLCPTVPDNTFNGTDNSWTLVLPPFDVNDGVTAGAAQYHIEIMGDGTTEDEIGQSSSYNCKQYGGSCGTPTVRHYRITARSHDPTTAGIGNRSLVVLQTTVRRAI